MNVVAFIASDSEDVLWNRFAPLFKQASLLRIASAFFGTTGEIVHWGQQESYRRVEIIIRPEYPTNANSVRELRKNPQVTILAADTAKMPFHEKLYIAIDTAGVPIGAYIGSANWTQSGLKKNREAGVWVTDQEVLRQMNMHFLAAFKDARTISDQMLEQIDEDRRGQENLRRRPNKDRGTLISSWPSLKATSDGQFLIRQGGTHDEPFIEGTDFHDFMGKYNFSSAYGSQDSAEGGGGTRGDSLTDCPETGRLTGSSDLRERSGGRYRPETLETTAIVLDGS